MYFVTQITEANLKYVWKSILTTIYVNFLINCTIKIRLFEKIFLVSYGRTTILNQEERSLLFATTPKFIYNKDEYHQTIHE